MCGGMSDDKEVMRKEVIRVETGHNNVVKSASRCKNHEKIIYAVAATTGATGVVSTGLGSSTAFSASTGAAGVSGVASVAGFSRGATGVGSSIFGGFSSTLGGTACSSFGFDLKKPPTRADRRRVTFKAFTFDSSSFCEKTVRIELMRQREKAYLLLLHFFLRGLNNRSLSRGRRLGLLHGLSRSLLSLHRLSSRSRFLLRWLLGSRSRGLTS